MLSASDVASRLAGADLVAFDLRPDDLADLRRELAGLTDDDRERIARAADRLLTRIGDFTIPDSPAFAGCEDEPGRPPGLLPLAALVATAADVRRFQAARRVGPAESGLRDLGQQLWVHRRTFGSFGLHAQNWLTCPWSGALVWLGRLQFNVQRLTGPHSWDDADHWVLGTHIPETGPLTPQSVDASFELARGFFADRFPGVRVECFYCSSWLLDPALTDALPVDSNLARFQRRWTLYGDGVENDDEVVFFVFRRRGGDLAGLPRDTTLQRAVLDRIDAGGHWHVRSGTLPLTGRTGVG
jgi:hypothetical protein